MKLLHLLPLLTIIIALPNPQPNILSLFESSSIPVVNDPPLSQLFNTTAHLPRDMLPLNKRAVTLDYILFTITVDGTSQNNAEAFLLTGELLLTSGISSPGTTNGANPVEAVLSVGNPYSNPLAGSIRYSTSRYLWPLLGGASETSVVDFAYVGSTDTAVGVTIDGSLAAANTISVFNIRSGLTADVYNPVEGGFAVGFGSDGSVAGEIKLVGRGLISGARGTYGAVIKGAVTQTGSVTV